MPATVPDTTPGSSHHPVDAAFEWAYPLYAIALTRYRAVQDPGNPRRHAPNTWQHERRLADHAARRITAPNNDTLYSNAWVDLSQGPVTLRVAAMPAGRYWSVAMMDAFTNHFAIVGQRLDGAGPVEVTLLGPAWHRVKVPGRGVRMIRAPGNDAWLFARCLVDGPADLPNAHAMQECLSLSEPAGARHAERVVPTTSTDACNFLAVVNDMLGRNPPPLDEAALLAQWAALGTAGARGRRNVQGWITAGPEIGGFGKNFALRASVAHGGLGALPPIEATYFVRFHDEAGAVLDGRRDHLLTIPASGIPTDSFWSFSMYQPEGGMRFFVDNPIHRYSIGNRTPGLVSNPDGSLDIALTHTAPADARLRANWLPTPDGLFQISLRCYMPRSELRAGEAAMPRIARLPG